MRCVSPLLAFYKGVSPATWLNANPRKIAQLACLTWSFFCLACQDIWEGKKTGIQKYPGWWQLKYFMIFLPKIGEDAQFSSKGLVQPPTNTLFNPQIRNLSLTSLAKRPSKTLIRDPTAFWRMGEWEAQSDLNIRLVEEILHHLGCKKLVNNAVNYQPQLVSLPDFWTINSMFFVEIRGQLPFAQFAPTKFGSSLISEVYTLIHSFYPKHCHLELGWKLTISSLGCSSHRSAHKLFLEYPLAN